MLENTVTAGVWLTLVSLVVSLFTLTILVLLYLLIQRGMIFLVTHWPAPTAPPAASGAAAVVAAKKAEAALKPGRSCGHCGVRIKGDPVRGIALDEKSFLVYACPDCKKETLLPQ